MKLIKCPRTGKRIYYTRLSADLALADINMKLSLYHKQRSGKTPIRSYECFLCHHWHLTSQPKSNQNEQVD